MSKLLTGFQIFLTLVLLAGIQVQACDPCDGCIGFLEFERTFRPFEHLKREKSLDELCMNVTDVVKIIESIGCFDPRTPSDFLLSYNVSYIFRDIANTLNLTDEICTNVTQLQEDYLTHSQCFQNVHDNIMSVCRRQSMATFDRYTKFHLSRHIPWSVNELQCLMTSHQLACLGNAIHEECGDHALHTFKETIAIFGYFKIRMCSTETMQDAMTSLINNLPMDESQKRFAHGCLVEF